MRETWKLSNNRGFTHAQAVSPWLWSLPYAWRAQRTRIYMPESLADYLSLLIAFCKPLIVEFVRV